MYRGNTAQVCKMKKCKLLEVDWHDDLLKFNRLQLKSFNSVIKKNSRELDYNVSAKCSLCSQIKGSSVETQKGTHKCILTDRVILIRNALSTIRKDTQIQIREENGNTASSEGNTNLVPQKWQAPGKGLLGWEITFQLDSSFHWYAPSSLGLFDSKLNQGLSIDESMWHKRVVWQREKLVLITAADRSNQHVRAYFLETGQFLKHIVHHMHGIVQVITISSANMYSSRAVRNGNFRFRCRQQLREHRNIMDWWEREMFHAFQLGLLTLPIGLATILEVVCLFRIRGMLFEFTGRQGKLPVRSTN